MAHPPFEFCSPSRRIAAWLLLVVSFAGFDPPEAWARTDAELQPRERFAGRIATPGDVDSITYSALAGTELTLIVTAQGGTALQPRLAVTQGGVELKPQIAALGKSGREHRLVRIPIEETAPVSIEIRGSEDSLGDYRLKLRERMPTKFTWKPKLAAGAIKSFGFTARAGSALKIELERIVEVDAPLGVPVLVLPDGEHLSLEEFAHTQDDGVGVGPVILEDDGEYRVEIAAPSDESEHLALRVGVVPQKGAGATIVEAAGAVLAGGTLFLENGDWLADETDAGDFVADELVAAFDSIDRAHAVAARLGWSLRSISPSGLALLRRVEATTFSRASDDATRRRVLDACARVRREAGVQFAEPNFLRASFATPNDALFPQQWDYAVAGFTSAADLTSGDAARTIAVLDTGVRFDHPDLASRFVPGFDFVSDSWNGGDGNGMDSDPTDPALAQGTHGTHVSGTIVAARDNAIGIAGAIGAGRVLPLRVLGVLGGTDYDIAQAILYAARLPNLSGTLPPLRAEVINMSLGGPNSSAALDSAVKQAIAAGVIVVAAAGNANSKNKMYPAGIDGVIAVGATDRKDERAFYSSYGLHLSLVAPGGDPWADVDSDGFPDGILSTTVDPFAGATYTRKSGTSMAAPHVAAAAFLLRSIRPELSPLAVRAQLCAAAFDLGAPGPDKFYGYGRLDTGRAIQCLLGTDAAEKDVFAFPSTLGFDLGVDQRELALVDVGNGAAASLNSASTTAFWLSVTSEPGPLPRTLFLEVDRSGLLPGIWTSTVALETSVGWREVPVTVTVPDSGAPPLVARAYVVAWDVARHEVTDWIEVDSADGGVFEFDALPEGTYRFFAATDLDFDGVVGESHDFAGAAVQPQDGSIWFPLADGSADSDLVLFLDVGAVESLPKGGDLDLATSEP